MKRPPSRFAYSFTPAVAAMMLSITCGGTRPDAGPPSAGGSAAAAGVASGGEAGGLSGTGAAAGTSGSVAGATAAGGGSGFANSGAAGASPSAGAAGHSGGDPGPDSAGSGGTSAAGGGSGGMMAGGAAGSAGTAGNTAARRLRPAPNGRHLQWSDGTPVFLLSDTAWLLPARYSPAEVAAHVTTRVAQGFTAIQMTASFPENGYQSLSSVFTDGDFTTPVEAYWAALDDKIEQCTDAGLVVILNPFWKKTGDATLDGNGPTKCRAYGKWLGARYRTNTRVAYFVGGDATPGSVRDELGAIGLGIQEAYAEAGLPPAIIAYHGAPQRTSREEWPDDPSWLTLDWSYAYSEPLNPALPYQENWSDWRRTPVLPIMFGEGWYDRDNGATNSSRWGNRYMLRRQAWWNPLSGALAGYAYGAEPIWFHRYGGSTPAQAALWNSGLDAARMKKFLDTLEWWRLRPDLTAAFITAGNSAPGTLDHAVGALADDGSFGVVYSPGARTLTLRMPLGRNYTIRWFDPSNGTYRSGEIEGAPGESVVMRHPGNNASNAPDWVIHVAE